VRPMRKLEHHPPRVCKSNAAKAPSYISLPLQLARREQEPIARAILFWFAL